MNMLKVFKTIKNKYAIFKNINLVVKKKPKIIFYSEGLSYQKYAYLLINALSKKYPGQVYYVSTGVNDKIDNSDLKNLFIGDGFLMHYFFSSIITENLFLTLTDLNNHSIKKTKNVKNIEVGDVKKYASCFKVNSVKGIIFIDRIGKNKFSKPEILYNILKSFIY